MKKDDYLEDLHVGSIIKKIAQQRHVSAKILADAIRLYQEDNADKIYFMDDMDCKDIVTVSYLLKYNILDFIAKQHLSHLPFPDCVVNAESRLMKIDMKNKQAMIYDPSNNCNFLKTTNIGQNIKKFADKKGWKQKDMAKYLDRSQGTVSNLYKSKSLRVKTLIWISDVLQYHFIAEAYLSQMLIVPSFNMVEHYTIALNLQQIYIENPNDDTFSTDSRRENDEK